MPEITEKDLHRARLEFRATGDTTEPLFRELADIARALVKYGRLPASYSPYGKWDEEARIEILQAWIADKLLRGGGLGSLLDRADTVSGFRRMAEVSLRQFVLNQRQRSQAQNLYWRTDQILNEDERFVILQKASRAQDAVWTLSGHEHDIFGGDDRQLLAIAWSLGDFELIRYKASADKLSPLLSSGDLERFIAGMLHAGGAMKLSQLAKALELRFDLGPTAHESFQAEHPPVVASQDSIADDQALRESALTVVADLTARQVAVLLGRRAEETWDALAEELGCSPATIANEERRIAATVERHSENEHEKQQLLRITGDLLYEKSGYA